MNPVRHFQAMEVLKAVVKAAKAVVPAKAYDCRHCVYFGNTCPECSKREELVQALQVADGLIEREELAK